LARVVLERCRAGLRRGQAQQVVRDHLELAASVANDRAGAELLDRAGLTGDAVELDGGDRLDMEAGGEMKAQRHLRPSFEPEVRGGAAADRERRAHHAEQPPRSAQHPRRAQRRRNLLWLGEYFEREARQLDAVASGEAALVNRLSVDSG